MKLYYKLCLISQVNYCFSTIQVITDLNILNMFVET